MWFHVPSVLWHCWLSSRNGIRPVKYWVVWCWHGYSVWGEVQICIWPSWCQCHSLSCSSKSRFVLPFSVWYRLIRVVQDKGSLNGCCCLLLIWFHGIKVSHVKLFFNKNCDTVIKVCHNLRQGRSPCLRAYMCHQCWFLYPPSERSETGRYTVLLLFPSIRPSICVHSYLDANMMQVSWKRFEIDAWYQLPTNRKWPMVDRMMTSLMTSCDRKRSRSWSQYL